MKFGGAVVSKNPTRVELRSEGTQPRGWIEAVSELPGIRTILLVDDQDANISELRSLLDIEGRRIVTARTADGANELLHRSPVELVILNADLRVVSGADCCRSICDHHP